MVDRLTNDPAIQRLRLDLDVPPDGDAEIEEAPAAEAPEDQEAAPPRPTMEQRQDARIRFSNDPAALLRIEHLQGEVPVNYDPNAEPESRTEEQGALIRGAANMMASLENRPSQIKPQPESHNSRRFTTTPPTANGTSAQPATTSPYYH